LKITERFGLLHLTASNPVDTSTKALIENAQKNLQQWSETGPKIPISFSSVSFWLEPPSILEPVRTLVEIKDISQIKPNCRVTIEVVLNLIGISYKIVIRTVATETGILQLRHPEVTDIDFPYASKDLWETAKNFAKENSLALAGLALSTFNAALNVLRLAGKLP
jgi:hypothetical protein